MPSRLVSTATGAASSKPSSSFPKPKRSAVWKSSSAAGAGSQPAAVVPAASGVPETDLASLQVAQVSLVTAPAGEDAALLEKINELRAQGVRVIQALSGDNQAVKSSAELVLENGEWTVKGL